jgi:hypothetical protein
MSAQVSCVPRGKRYNHSFLDDLESFFWLILWSVAFHLDPGQTDYTNAARDVLWSLDRPDREDLMIEKQSLLMDCCHGTGDDMKQLLQGFDNSWASDPAIISTIVGLGHFFCNVDMGYIRPGQPPTTVFPFVAGTIMGALGESMPEGFSDYRISMFDRLPGVM